VNVSYGTAGVATFKTDYHQSLNANPFSAGGDSGSLIVTDVTQQPTGLSSPAAPLPIANPIQAVLAALGVTIVTWLLSLGVSFEVARCMAVCACAIAVFLYGCRERAR
jgi:hypothetical protein